MLTSLRINQFVIIDSLDLELESGLTILTGETGAGKSILLDAMGLILGEDANKDSIRTGSDQSIIEADFKQPSSHPSWTFLQEQGIVSAPEEKFTIRRVIKKASEETIEVNGKPIKQDVLKKLGEFLVEIHGQFANQSLMEPENQLTLLDLSGNFPPDVFKNVADALRDVRGYKKALDEENLFLAQHQSKAKKIDAVVKKFNDIGMYEGFIEEAQAEYSRLLIAKETSEALQVILGQLIAGNGVIVSLSGVNQTIERQKNLEAEKVAKLKEDLKNSLEYARNAVAEVGRIAPEYEIDTGPLNHYKSVLNTLETIATDNKIPFDDLTQFYLEQSEKLRRIQNGREKVAELQNALIDAKNNYREHAAILTEKRIVAGKKLSEDITRELAPLKLERAQFDVRVEEKPTIPWTERGLNEVVFVARMNPGQSFSPIADTASGGEMARMMLALKVVVQAVQTTSTLVFDEVDTGIGGAAAAAVGERLATLSDNTQVLVITHSPQVASRGQQHLHVSKQTDGVTTTSVLRKLSEQERTDEISRMLSGDELTAESQAAAKRLIDEAQSAAKARLKA